MALSDSEIDTTELEMLYKMGDQRGVHKSDIDAAILQPDTIKFKPPSTVLEKIDCLYDFALIAWADGTVDPNEKRLIEVFCSKFGFHEENIPSITLFLLEEAQKGTPKENIISTVSENL